MLKYLLPLLGIILFIFFIIINPSIPKNIYCFLDIGTHRLPTHFIEVDSSHSYGQTFVSNFDNLFKVSIFIAHQNLNSKILFSLKKNPQDKDSLFTTTLNPQDIHPPYHDFYTVPVDAEIYPTGFHYHIPFPPIKNSKGKSFYFYLECPNCPIGEGLKIGAWQDLLYYEALTQGTAFLNHKEIKGFLAFRTFNTWTSSYSMVWKEIQNRLFQDKIFFITYLSCLLSIFIGYISLRIAWRKSKFRD